MNVRICGPDKFCILPGENVHLDDVDHYKEPIKELYLPKFKIEDCKPFVFDWDVNIIEISSPVGFFKPVERAKLHVTLEWLNVCFWNGFALLAASNMLDLVRDSIELRAVWLQLLEHKEVVVKWAVLVIMAQTLSLTSYTGSCIMSEIVVLKSILWIPLFHCFCKALVAEDSKTNVLQNLQPFHNFMLGQNFFLLNVFILEGISFDIGETIN